MFYNFLLENIILPIGDALNSSAFISELKKWRKITNLSEAELNDLQKDKLGKLLKFTVENIPFYKNLNLQYNNNPYEFIKSFPVIKKMTIKAHEDDFLLHPGRKSNLIKYASSGSSGIQGYNYIDKKEQSINRAIQVLWWEWAGYKVGDKIFQTGMALERGFLKSLKDFLFRTKYVRAFGLSDAQVKDMLQIVANKPDYILAGYASSLYVLAEVAMRNNIKNVKFRSAVTWGDKLFDSYRKAVFEAFGARTYETYGCGEGIMLAAQKDLDYMYIMSPHVYVEIVDEHGNELPDGEMGYVLVTRLDAYNMPLIRYYLGDLAIKLPRVKYPEKRDLQLPILQKVIGRDTDIVRTRSGKFMIVHFFTGIFEYYPQIRQFYVVQKNLDEIEINYIPESNFRDEILSEITRQIHEHLDEPFPIRYIKTDHIPPSPSGKPQIIQSFIEKKVKI